MQYSNLSSGRSSAAIPAIVMVFCLCSAQPAFAQADSQTVQGQDGAVGATTDAAAENQEAPTDETASDEGASSFSSLCGNGQGKPKEGEVRKKRKGLFGLADRFSAMTRKIPLVGDFMVDSANSLSQSISCRLYPEEQKQAVEATQEATRSEEIGKTVEWQSTVRENVSGSSTVAAKSQRANGTPCLTVSDIIIVDGEELRVSKQMCRLPGAARYTIVTA